MTVLHPITMVIGPCTAVLPHKALTTVCRVQTPHSTLEGGTAVWRLPNTTRTIVRRRCYGQGVGGIVSLCLERRRGGGYVRLYVSPQSTPYPLRGATYVQPPQPSVFPAVHVPYNLHRTFHLPFSRTQKPGLQIFFLLTRFPLSHLPYVEPGLQILALITLSKILLTSAPYASQPDHPETSLYTVQAGALGPSPFGSAARRRRDTVAGAPSGTAPPTSPSGLGTEVQWN